MSRTRRSKYMMSTLQSVSIAYKKCEVHIYNTCYSFSKATLFFIFFKQDKNWLQGTSSCHASNSKKNVATKHIIRFQFLLLLLMLLCSSCLKTSVRAKCINLQLDQNIASCRKPMAECWANPLQPPLFLYFLLQFHSAVNENHQNETHLGEQPKM